MSIADVESWHACKSDLVILRPTAPLSDEAAHRLVDELRPIYKETGVRFIVVDSHTEVDVQAPVVISAARRDAIREVIAFLETQGLEGESSAEHTRTYFDIEDEG